MSHEDLLSNPLYQAPNSHADAPLQRLRALVGGVIILMITCWAATVYVAACLGYQPVLGQPMLSIGGWKLYFPMDWLTWYSRWHAVEVPAVIAAFQVAKWLTLLGVAAAIIYVLVSLSRESKRRALGGQSLHGSAHWASAAEVARTGLLKQSAGVYIGAWKDAASGRLQYLRHDGPEHLMAFAPTRSGKGVGLVLPTLLSWPHSAVVYDIKGENWALTSGWRRQEAHNRVIKFEPSSLDGSSARFNPLAEIRAGTDWEVADAQNITTMIVDPDGKGLKDHWQKSSQALLVAVVLHVLYAEKNKTLNGVLGFLSEPSRDVRKSMQWMLDTDHDLTGPGWLDTQGKTTYCHPVVAAAARDMLNKADEEMSSVLSTSIAYLTLYRDPIVARNTALSDFRIRDLMNADDPVSLYLVVPPSDKDRLRPLIRLLVTQIVRGLTEKMGFKDGRSVAAYKHRLLLMLDEFPSLGKLDVFEESLAFIAGYGLKAYLIIQDISQLWTAYGKDESIFSNCHVRVAYAPNKIETAELLSKMAGTATIVKSNEQYSGSLFGGKTNVTNSTQESQRPLLTADEVMRLPAARKDANGNVIEPGDMLIFMAGQTPIYGKQILYFMDPTFSQRAKLAAPDKSDLILVEEIVAPDRGALYAAQEVLAPAAAAAAAQVAVVG
jgi:type IV secretion system protein VirD4